MATVSEFHVKAPQATVVSEELAQGPYAVARAGFEPGTLRTKGAESTNEPPCPKMYIKEEKSSPFSWSFSWLKGSYGQENVSNFLTSALPCYMKVDGQSTPLPSSNH